MTSENPYEPPKASLDNAISAGADASLDDAIAGRYDFEVGEVMSEAWDLTKGFKARFWGIFIISMVVSESLKFAFGIFAGAIIPGDLNPWVSGIINVLAAALIAPLTLGQTMMAVRRAAGLPVSFSTGFGYFSQAGAAVGAFLLVMLLMVVGFAFLLVPGVYLAIGYGMTQPLIGDRKLSAWRAMEVSRQAVGHKWSRCFGLAMAVLGLMFLSALPLGIGLIWTLPWTTMVIGVAYRRIFGVASAAAT